MKCFVMILALWSLTSFANAAGPACSGLFETASSKEEFNLYEPWGKQIFNRDIEAIKKAFQEMDGLTPTEKINILLEKDIRKIFFRLQSLSRVYQGMNNERFEQLRLFFKSIEDGLGKVDLARSLKKRSEKIEEPELVDFFMRQEIEAQKNLVKVLEDSGLLKDPERALAHVQRKIGQAEGWTSIREDRAYLVRFIADYAKDLRKDIKKKLFDDADIEKGLHELRRRIRWIVIQGMTLNGAVVMKSEAELSVPVEQWFRQALKENPELLNNKYIKTMEPLVDRPIEIPMRTFALLGELVSKIGDSKDGAELQIYAREALEHMGASEIRIAEIEEKIERVFAVQRIDHQALSRQMQEQIDETDLLKEFVREIKRNTEE